MATRWYGEDVSFRIALEADARRRYGRNLIAEFLPDMPWGLGTIPGDLVYIVDGLDVRGRVEAVPVEVRFSALAPPGLRHLIAAQDYPSVHADRGKKSPHRLHHDGLCLYYPADPPELRWSASMGLLSLLDAAAEHLYFEDYALAHNGEWLGAEAPHRISA